MNKFSDLLDEVVQETKCQLCGDKYPKVLLYALNREKNAPLCCSSCALNRNNGALKFPERNYWVKGKKNNET